MHPETLWRVCLRLDDQRNVKNWMDLGSEIGISMSVLRKFKDPSGHSPSKAILEKIKSLDPTLSMTRIQTVLRDLNLHTIERKLDRLRGNKLIERVYDLRRKSEIFVYSFWPINYFL